MKRVIDASVAAKWFVEEDGSAPAIALLAEDALLIAPELVLAELCNLAWKKHRLGEISTEHAAAFMRAAPGMFGLLEPARSLTPRALEIATEIGHPAYDCYYLALAERETAELVTDDRRLLERTRGTAWEARVAPLRQTR